MRLLDRTFVLESLPTKCRQRKNVSRCLSSLFIFNLIFYLLSLFPVLSCSPDPAWLTPSPPLHSMSLTPLQRICQLQKPSLITSSASIKARSQEICSSEANVSLPLLFRHIFESPTSFFPSCPSFFMLCSLVLIRDHNSSHVSVRQGFKRWRRGRKNMTKRQGYEDRKGT